MEHSEMSAVLATDRLRLRPVSPEDEAVVVSVLNDLDVSGWLSVVPYPYTSADFHHFRSELAKPSETFAVLDTEGFAGVVRAGRELGYWFAPRCHGRGYATEAARAVLAEQFGHDVRDVDSGYFEGNARSANVLRKLGFVETGREPNHCRALGVDRPHVDMLLTRDAFNAAFPIEARSARLTFRALQPSDTDALHALHSDWAVVRQLGSWPWPPERDFAATRARRFGGVGFVWGVFLDQALIGTFGLTDGIVGYSLASAHWGKGFATELLTTALQHGFNNYAWEQVTADAWFDNAASLALLRRAGFHEVRRTVEMSKARQAETGLVHFVLSRAEWLARPTTGSA